MNSTFLQTLSEVNSDWSSQPTDITATLSKAVGMCCLSVCVSVYLPPLPTHTQLDIINSQVLPIMKERGVELHFPVKDQLLSAFVSENHISKDLDKTPSNEDDVSHCIDESTQSVIHVCSYSELAQAVVSTIAPQSSMHSWLSSCCSVSQTIGFGLVEGAWRKWPLMYDPHGLAREWVKSTIGETLISLDGENRWE